MSAMVLRNWQEIHAELMRRITEREWQPGEPVPNEADLAAQFGCARATVNRAMREIAEAGFIVRKRKGGTHVALNPVRRAILSIPVTRIEIENLGHQWRHEMLHKGMEKIPALIGAAIGKPAGTLMLRVRALHFADERPFVHEDRWINPLAVPQAVNADFSQTSANEWLVRNAPFTRGEIELTAVNATQHEARLLQTKPGAAILVVVRTTFLDAEPITRVRLAYAPGHAMQMML